MTAKEYLGQAFRIDQRINSKLEQITSLRKLASKATLTMTGMPRSVSPNLQSMESTIVKLADLEVEINRDIDEMVDLKQEIVSLVKRIDNVESRTLLELRYLCFKSWEQIAEEMAYDLRYLHKLHNRALDQVNSILDLSISGT
jgi:hypothetical protein